MKKVLFALVAAGMTMTSCMNEEFPNATSYGQLNVNVSNDLQMNTRASVAVSDSDLSTWKVSAVGSNQTTYTLTTKSTNVKAGTYTVSAKSHESEAEALTGWGAAYYEGSTSGVVVEAGQTVPVTVDCGKAKNARLKVQFSLISNFTEYSLTAVTAPNRNLVFDASNSSTALAYYGATEVVNYTLSYKYNGTLKEIPGQITMKGAATENIISIASNDNGTISVTVNYDDTFGTGNSENLVFDAATGEKIS